MSSIGPGCHRVYAIAMTIEYREKGRSASPRHGIKAAERLFLDEERPFQRAIITRESNASARRIVSAAEIRECDSHFSPDLHGLPALVSKTWYRSRRSELCASCAQTGQKYGDAASIADLQCMLAVHVGFAQKIAISQEEPVSDLSPVRLPDRKVVTHRSYFSRACVESADTRKGGEQAPQRSPLPAHLGQGMKRNFRFRRARAPLIAGKLHSPMRAAGAARGWVNHSTNCQKQWRRWRWPAPV